MDKAFTILTIGFQFFLTLFVSVCIYMVYAILDNNFGIDGFFGLAIIQPIFGVFFSLLTIFVCIVIGLPIRFNKRVNKFWTSNFYITILLILIGLILLVLALFPNLKETVIVQIDGKEAVKHIPNSFLSYTGWFLTAFSLLHLYLPRQITDKLKSMYKKDLIETPDFKM